MTDQEFRKALDEYLSIDRQYETLAGMHRRLYQRKNGIEFPPHVSSLDEIAEVRDKRRVLEIEMSDINSQMMQLATKRVDLGRVLKEALPPGVVYHYNGHEVEVHNRDLCVRPKVEEMAA
jgi:hypothetical protein